MDSGYVPAGEDAPTHLRPASSRRGLWRYAGELRDRTGERLLVYVPRRPLAEG